MKRIDEVKAFSIQSAKKLVDASYDRLLRGIEAEFKESERLKVHLRGHDAPVSQSILDEVLAPKLDERIKIVQANVSALNTWVRDRSSRDAQDEDSFTNLERDRPQAPRSSMPSIMSSTTS